MLSAGVLGETALPRFLNKMFETVDGGEGGKCVIDPALAGHAYAWVRSLGGAS